MSQSVSDKPAAGMTLGVILRLGRVSNLPTVWTNAMAGGALALVAGAGELSAASFGAIALAALALSAFYVGGMWLNDAFDAEIDKIERANRPIPNGEIARSTVFIVGFALLGVGLALSFLLGAAAGLCGLALAVFILLYDWLHKRTVFSPVLMGATRFFAVGLGALSVGAFEGPALYAALGLFAYVIGLTYAAKQEAYDRIDRAWPLAALAAPVLYCLWLAASAPMALPFLAALAAVMGFALFRLFRRAKGDVPVAVVTLIAGIALYDATLMAASGEFALALVAVAAFGLTLFLQKSAPGT